MCNEMPFQKRGTLDRHSCCNHKPLSSAEKQRLFSQVAAALVSDKLDGKVQVGVDDIQLEMTDEHCGAILISDRLNRNPDFQKMWAERSCLSELKKLARAALENKLYIAPPDPSF